MSIQELIELVRRKLTSLSGARSHAYLVGDVDAVDDWRACTGEDDAVESDGAGSVDSRRTDGARACYRDVVEGDSTRRDVRLRAVASNDDAIERDRARGTHARKADAGK